MHKGQKISRLHVIIKPITQIGSTENEYDGFISRTKAQRILEIKRDEARYFNVMLKRVKTGQCDCGCNRYLWLYEYVNHEYKKGA